jgi:hypothetical protein
MEMEIRFKIEGNDALILPYYIWLIISLLPSISFLYNCTPATALAYWHFSETCRLCRKVPMPQYKIGKGSPKPNVLPRTTSSLKDYKNRDNIYIGLANPQIEPYPNTKYYGILMCGENIADIIDTCDMIMRCVINVYSSCCSDWTKKSKWRCVLVVLWRAAGPGLTSTGRLGARRGIAEK